MFPGFRREVSLLAIKFTLLTQAKDIIKNVWAFLDKEKKLTKKVPQRTVFAASHSALEFIPWKEEFKKLYTISLKD